MNRKYIFPAVLLAAGLVLNFVFSGYDFIAYTLYLIAALIVAFGFMGRRLRTVVCVILAICLVYFIAVEIPIVRSASGDADFEADYIIVLGALVRGEQPSLSMLERTQAALDYMNSHPDTTVIVSGGQGDMEDISEAEAMYRWLIGKGADESRIILEDKSTSTEENLRYSFDIIRSRGDDPAEATAVVTSEYHIYRAKLIGHDMGVELCGISAHTSRPGVKLNYFIREAFGVTYKWIFG